MRKTRATSTNITQRTNSQSEPSQSLKQPSTEAPTLKGKRHTLFTDNVYLCLNEEDQPHFMKSFIKKGPKGYGICDICPPLAVKKEKEQKKAREIATENIYQHILSDAHSIRVKKEDRAKYNNLVEVIKNLKAQNKKKSQWKSGISRR